MRGLSGRLCSEAATHRGVDGFLGHTCPRCIVSAARVSVRCWRLVPAVTATAARVQEWATGRGTAFHLVPALHSSLTSIPLLPLLSSSVSFLRLSFHQLPRLTRRSAKPTPPSRSHVDRKRQGALRRPAPGPALQRSSPSSQARRGRRIPPFFFSSTRQRQHIRTPLRRTRSSSRRSFASFASLDFDLLR